MSSQSRVPRGRVTFVVISVRIKSKKPVMSLSLSLLHLISSSFLSSSQPLDSTRLGLKGQKVWTSQDEGGAGLIG